MTKHQLIQKYEAKVFILDYKINTIKIKIKIKEPLINSNDDYIEDLKQECSNAIADKRLYNQFVKDLKDLK